MPSSICEDPCQFLVRFFMTNIQQHVQILQRLTVSRLSLKQNKLLFNSNCLLRTKNRQIEKNGNGRKHVSTRNESLHAVV